MIDSHCHLFFDSIKNDFDNIILRSIKNNITSILSINTDPEDFEKHYQLITQYKSLYISYGLHPENVKSNNIPSIKDIELFCKYDRVIGIGETGLDFYRSLENKNSQYKSFENHIESSYNTNLPIIIHQRNSEKEIIDIISYYNKRRPLKIVFHCFTGSEILKNFCLDNDFYISLSGIITFKNAQKLREIILNFPLNKILVETDSPFLAPTPLRGKKNEPSYVKFIGDFLSSIFNISIEDFTETTDNNFYKLFSKAIRYNQISK